MYILKTSCKDCLQNRVIPRPKVPHPTFEQEEEEKYDKTKQSQYDTFFYDLYCHH